MNAWWVASLLACTSSPPAEELGLDGPARVRVESLGPVDGPDAVLADGKKAEGVTWTAKPESVAKIEGGEVHAVGPGEATVTGEWQGQKVEWTLVVEPTITLVFVDAPARVNVGETVPLKIDGRLGEEKVAPGSVTWSSSDAAVADVSATGEVTGYAPGIAYVTATAGNSEAMLEIEVVSP
jgi:hypothetical protein